MGTESAPTQLPAQVRRRAWLIGGTVAALLGAGAVTLTLSMRSLDAPAGELADGTAWGSSLGAVVAESTGLGAGYSFSEIPAAAPSGDVVFVASEEALDVLASDDLRTITQTPNGISYSDMGSLSGFLLAPAGDRGFAVYDSGSIRSYAFDGSDVSSASAWIADAGYDSATVGSDGETLGLSPDASRLYIGLASDELLVLDAATGAEIARHAGMGGAVGISPVDGSVIVSPGRVAEVETYPADALASADPASVLARADGADWEMHRLALSPGGDAAIALVEDGRSFTFDPRTLSSRVEFPSDIDAVWDAVFLDDGDRVLVLGSDAENRDALFMFTKGSDRIDVQIPLNAERASFGHLDAGLGPSQILVGGDRTLLAVDISASRTPFPWYLIVAGGMLVAALAAVVAAATVQRWLPAYVRASHAREEKAQSARAEYAAERERREEVRRAAAAARTAEQQAAAQQREQEREQRAHDERVTAITQWQMAYADANGGQMPPAGFVPPLTPSPSAAARINVMAILALVFGLGGGLLGIVFGHIALSQIARSGERGRALALTGLILGYVGLAAIIVLAIVAFSISARWGSF